MKSDPSAVREWRRRRAAVCRSLLKPPPRLTISEWADRHRIIPQGTSPEPGPWRTDRAPYLRGIMDALSDRSVQRVAAMLASQTGKSEAVLNTIGYYVDQEPSPILVVQPNEKPMGEAFAKDRLAPMIRSTPVLASKIKSPKVKDSGNTMLHKSFAGGHVTITGANSAAGLASRPIRVVLFDEVDRYERSAGNEGDPVSLGIQRTANFTWTRKVFLVSTPGIAGLSRIEREWGRSDQRRFMVPCPHCDHRQHLVWGNVVWSQVAVDDFDGVVGRTNVQREGVVHVTATAQYRCEGCGELIPEDRKPWMLRSGEWVATRPEGEFPGFHLPALYSPWVTWAEMAQEFLAKKDDPTELQTFVNTKLAEPWEDRGERVSAVGLEARAEAYVTRDGEIVEVPHGVGFLTFGTDVQGDRLEILVRGWGEGEESWDILHERIWGDPEARETWARHEAIRTRGFRHASGLTMRIGAGMVDAGYLTDTVYGYVRPLEFSHVYAAMGDNGAEGNQPLRRPTRSNAAGVKLWTVGTFKLKDTVLKRLRIGRPGPRYMHLRTADPDLCNGFDSEYFAQAESEKIVTEIVKGSRVPRRKFVRIRKRNEFLDLHVLNLAALLSQGRAIREALGQLAKRASEYVPEPVAAGPSQPEREVPMDDGDDWATGGGRWGSW